MKTISFAKKAMFCLGVGAALLGGVATANENSAPASAYVSEDTDFSNPMRGADGKLYGDYSKNQSAEMLDAINRDHPVPTPY